MCAVGKRYSRRKKSAAQILSAGWAVSINAPALLRMPQPTMRQIMWYFLRKYLLFYVGNIVCQGNYSWLDFPNLESGQYRLTRAAEDALLLVVAGPPE